MQENNLNNLIKKPICFQSNNPNQIDLTLTNQKSMYKFSNIFKTGQTITNPFQLLQTQVASKEHLK